MIKNGGVGRDKLLAMRLSQLLLLNESQIQRPMEEAEVRHIFQECDALWLHSGDPRDPHAELTSGKCSTGFVDVLRVLRYTNLCTIFASQLVLRYEIQLIERDHPVVDWVIGSDHAGATLSFAVAQILGVQHDFTEKGPEKTQMWKRFEIKPNEVVLQVEELVTTTSTLQAVREGIRAGNPSPVNFYPMVLTLVHRSDTRTFDHGPIGYLVHFDIQTWDPADCPLCAQGSKRLKPKHNWAELTGRQ